MYIMKKVKSLWKKQADSQCGHEKAHEIRKQGSRKGIAGLFDSGGTEIDGNGIKGGLCGAQHHCDGTANLGIYTVARHQLGAYG